MTVFQVEFCVIFLLPSSCWSHRHFRINRFVAVFIIIICQVSFWNLPKFYLTSWLGQDFSFDWLCWELTRSGTQTLEECFIFFIELLNLSHFVLREYRIERLYLPWKALFSEFFFYWLWKWVFCLGLLVLLLVSDRSWGQDEVCQRKKMSFICLFQFVVIRHYYGDLCLRYWSFLQFLVILNKFCYFHRFLHPCWMFIIS